MPGLLDDPILQEYRRQRMFSTLSRLGQGLLMAAGGGNMAPGLSMAFSPMGGGMSPLDTMAMRREMEAERQRKAKASGYSALVGGPDPQTGIDWKTGRLSGGAPPQLAMAAGGGPTPQAAGLLGGSNPLLEGMTPQQQGLLRQMDPETGMGILAQHAFVKPGSGFTLSPGQTRYGPEGRTIATVPAKAPERRIVKGADDFRYYADTGERVLPKVRLKPEETFGEMQWDPNLQMYYQLAPSGERKYKRPTAGMEITTPEGTTIRTGVPTGGPSGNRLDEIKAASDGIDLALSKLDNVQTAIARQPGRAGLMGSVASITQNVTAMLGDFAQAAQESFGIDVGLGRVDPLVKRDFDAALSEMDVLENSLSYALARARKPTGRLNRNDVDNARQDVQLKGLRSRADVEARLNAITREFRQAQQALGRRMGMESGVKTNPYRRMSDRELMEEMRRQQESGGGPGTP